MAKTIMIQGTGSHVGKSVIVTALCRMLRQDGFKVAPFKSQNMSNNSYVTKEGGEIGRAQAVQAEAAGIAPTVDMNPILLKPNSDRGAQVVVHGRPFKTLNASEYQFHTLSLFSKVRESFERLRNEYEVVVIEGAGSPAEVNLQEYDIANMRVAEMADAPVILAGDIDRGGIFASFIGTVELIQAQYRHRVKAFLINKFRGDISLLSPGIDFLFQRTGIPNLGVLPYLHGLDVLEEDGLSDARIKRNRIGEDPSKVLIDVIWLPRISNFTDFAPFDLEPDVILTYLREVPNRLPDVLILPGTKSTMADLEYLRESGFERWIKECVESGVTVIGVCGGYQMLGKKIFDPYKAESLKAETEGLGHLPVETIFSLDKVTKQVRALHLQSGKEVTGYEIHMGESTVLENAPPVFKMNESPSPYPSPHGGEDKVRGLFDGCSVRDGQVWGAYLHGLFDSDEFRQSFLDELRIKKGLPPLVDRPCFPKKDILYNRLADWLRANIDRHLLHQILQVR